MLYFERKADLSTGYVLTFEHGAGDLISCRTSAYVPCKPVAVRVGQLVEVQASFCAVPITKGRYLMLSKLRSICILNTQVQEVSQ